MYDSIVILGPTATGKTKISIQLAKHLNTEIINADSMYIYKEFNIGSAKPNQDEMCGINHYLIDFVNPTETFNVSDYRGLAKKIIEEFRLKNKTPIIVGGTGFYIDSLISNYSYGESEKDLELRNNLENEYNNLGPEYLHNKLSLIDKESANRIHMNDKARVIRALELALSGNKKSEIVNNEKPILNNPLLIGLNFPRDILYERINNRVDLMLESGLLEEVRGLIDKGYTPTNNQCMKGIGYKELFDYYNGDISLEDAIEKIKQHTRNYAKRQITWFKRNLNIIWLNPLEDKNLTQKIINLFNKKEND